MTVIQQRLAAVASGTYHVDPVHSRIGFSANHLGINWVKGRFESFEGTIEIPDGLSSAKVSGVIKTSSLNTHFLMRDDYLRSADFFDVENHPKLYFATWRVTPGDEKSVDIDGEITIRGVTKAIFFSAQLGGSARDQYDNVRLGLAATGVLNLSDFGMPYNKTVAGIPIVADAIKFELDVEAIRLP